MQAAALKVPVVFIVFKRPGLTVEVFARIRESRPAKLFIVADGPRPGHRDEAEKCRQVRELIERGIDWPCEVVRDYSDRNLGSALRVSSGITRVFQQVEEAIILEDDCLPDPTFFPFCAELLERYRGDERVAQIAGCSFRAIQPDNTDSYFFSQYPHCWGWATWRRAWRHYDHSMAAWRDPVRRRELLLRIESPAERKYWRHAFSGTLSERHDAWDYRWTLTCWSRGWLSIVASSNLVSNIGFGIDATHTRDQDPKLTLPANPTPFPLQHPIQIVRDSAADEITGQTYFRRPSLVQRCWQRLRRVVF